MAEINFADTKSVIDAVLSLMDAPTQVQPEIIPGAINFMDGYIPRGFNVTAQKDDSTQMQKTINELTSMVKELHAAQVGTLINHLTKDKKTTKKELERIKKLEEEALIEKLCNNSYRNVLNKK